MACVCVLTLIFCVIVSSCAIVIKRQAPSYNQKCLTPNKSYGTCIPVAQCKDIANFKPKNKQEQEALDLYRCGPKKEEETICCPNEDFNLDWIYEDCTTPVQSVGKCKPILSCKPLLEIIENNDITNEFASAIRNYTCSNKINRGNAMVCCPFKPIVIREKYRGIDSSVMDHSEHRNIGLLPTICGESVDWKIIEGKETKLYEFPWIAAIKHKSGDTENFGCGGTLINNRYILTAAHCIKYKKREIVSVRLGEHNLATEKDCQIDNNGIKYCAPPYQDFNVSPMDVLVHPEFNRDTLENDIALIRLRDEPDLSDFSVAPICLPITTSEKTNKVDAYTIIGWGTKNVERTSDILLKAKVPSQNYSKCSSNDSLRFKQICAGGVNETDVCNGDSGGPVMADYVENDISKIIQYGVISKGPIICAKENHPSTHTKVAAYMDWILDNLMP